MNILAYARRQDESLYIFRQLIKQGYDKGIWSLHEEHNEYDVCDLLDGRIFDLKELITDLEYKAPIFETSHVQCKCRLICYSTTNKDLDHITVDWKGDSEIGRVVDKKDKHDKSKDFQKLYESYRKKFDELSNDKYLTGKDSEPENGIYTFHIVLDEEHYYNQAYKSKISNEILDMILEDADRYNIDIRESNLEGNQYFVQIEYPLSIYDFSKSDLMDLTWTLEKRREELTEVMHELDDIKNWLKTTQNDINDLLISYESNYVAPKEKQQENTIPQPQVEPIEPAKQDINKDLQHAIEQNQPNIVQEPVNKIKTFEDIPRIEEPEDEENTIDINNNF